MSGEDRFACGGGGGGGGGGERFKYPPRENKIILMLYTGTNKDNQIMACLSPPSPAGFTLIGALIL